jgi:hypothetical protein
MSRVFDIVGSNLAQGLRAGINIDEGRIGVTVRGEYASDHARHLVRWATAAALSVALGVGFSITVGPAGASSRSTAIAEARKVLIVKSDFPTGWTASPSDNSNSNLGNAQVAACLDVPLSVVNYNPPSAYSPDFDYKSTGASISDDVSVFPNEKTVTEQESVFSSARTPGCFAKVMNTPTIKRDFEKQIGSGAVIGTVTAKWLPKPSVGDGATALQLSFPFTTSGQSFFLSLTLVTMVSKLVGAQLTFSTIGSQSIPPSLEAHLESVTAQRLR